MSATGYPGAARLDDLVSQVRAAAHGAEALAREVARATGVQASFSGASQAVLTVLSSHGFDVSRATLVDGSGLSVNDAVPATLLTELLSAAAAPDKSPAGEAHQTEAHQAEAHQTATHQQRTVALRPLLVGLPVAGRRRCQPKQIMPDTTRCARRCARLWRAGNGPGGVPQVGSGRLSVGRGLPCIRC